MYARLNVTRNSFDATAFIEMNIRDIKTKRNIRHKTFSNNYHCHEEGTIYSGHSRALSDKDWASLNNMNYNLSPIKKVYSRIFIEIYTRK